MVKRIWTLAERLAFGIGLALLALGLILGISGYATLSNLFENNLRERAESQARQLALFSADAILVYDYATLERYAKALADEPGVIAVSVLRDDGEVLASAGSDDVSADVSLIQVRQSLNIGNSQIGQVELSIDRHKMESSLLNLLTMGFLVLLLLILVLFFSLKHFVERGLIRPVQQLAMAANPLSPGLCPEPTVLPEELERIALTFRGLCSDIKIHLDEREHAELMMRMATERLTREQRLATVGQLAAGLAHNLNTPLGSIKGYAQLLSERVTDADHQRMSRLIVDQAESCAKTVGNLLTAVRMPEIEMQSFDIQPLVLGAIELIRPLLRDQLTRVQEPEDTGQAIMVNGDPAAVEQILFNLLTNSAQAGATTVSVGINKNKHQWCMKISDNGPGIPKNLRTSLFDPFVTSKPAGEGTGLGLYMSKKLAANMGSKLTISDQPEKSGACFILTFKAVSSKEINS